MILRRVTHHMKAQNWSAVAIEFVLVVLGVFLGIAAANWNEERLERRETQKLLRELKVELGNWVNYIDSVHQYYRAASGYADRAEAGWQRDPSVGDAEFVASAYQASQVTGIGNNTNVWSAIFGASNLRDIEDPAVRQNLATIMTFDYATVDLRAVATRYREEVRKTIPNDIQAQIREKCGDRPFGRGRLRLPPRCDLRIPENEARDAAAALRARPELLAELYWHRAAVANQLAQANIVRGLAADLTKRI